MNQAAPMVHMTPALWSLVALVAVAWLSVLWTVLRPKRKPAKPQHDVVSWRVLWWRKLASPETVRREIAPLAIQVPELGRLNQLFPDHVDAEEGDHAHA